MTLSVAGSIITQANESGISITAAASITGGVRFTCTQSYAAGNVVRITGTTNYNGNWYVSAATGTNFDVLLSVVGTGITFVSSQTGTAARGDASLAGLTGLTGVTTLTIDSSSGFVIYTLANNVKLQINGTLCIGGQRSTNTILGEEEMLVIGQNAAGSTQPDWRVGSGGVLTLGHRYTNTVNPSGGGTAPQFSDGVQPQTLIFQKGQYGRSWADGAAYTIDTGDNIVNTAFGVVANGGTLNWLTGTIDCWGGIAATNTSVINIGFPGVRQKPTLNNRRTGQPYYFYSSSLSVHGFVAIGDRGINPGQPQAGFGSAIGFLKPPLVFKGYEPRFMNTAVNGSSTMPAGTYTFEDYAGAVGTAYDVSKGCIPGATVNAYFKNSAIGTSMVANDDVDGNYNLYVTQTLNAAVRDTAGAAIQFAQVWGISLASVQSLGTTDAAGNAVIDNIETGFAGPTTGVITLRWAAGDMATFYVRAYEYLSASYSVILRGIGGRSLSATLLNDSGVTLSRTAASALAAIATLNDLYDASKFWNVQAANINYPSATTQVATAAGTTLDHGSRNIVVDATAASAFAVNTGTNTVTIKSSVLAVGSKFSTIKTTGTISFANGADASCPLQGIVVRGTTGVYSPKLESATVRFTAAGTYDLRGATISGTLTVTNTSGGAVTVQVQPSVTVVNLGPSITVDNAVTATFTVGGIIAGSRLLIRRTDTQAALLNEVVVGTSRAYIYSYTADIPVEIVVRKPTGSPAYQEWLTTATLTASGSAVTANQQPDE